MPPCVQHFVGMSAGSQSLKWPIAIWAIRSALPQASWFPCPSFFLEPVKGEVGPFRFGWPQESDKGLPLDLSTDKIPGQAALRVEAGGAPGCVRPWDAQCV